MTRRAPAPLAPDDPRHGSIHAYTHFRCRCPECRAENARVVAASRALRVLPPGDRRHGTLNGYSNYGCRCLPCRSEGTRRRRPGVIVIHDVECGCLECSAA